MKKTFITLMLYTSMCIGSITFSERINLYMENSIQAPQKIYSKNDACKLKDNRYGGTNIKINRPDSPNVQGEILFKKLNEIYYTVITTKDQTADTYLYQYNCMTKKDNEILNNDQLDAIRRIPGDWPAELAIIGFDKNTLLFWPNAGIEGVFGHYILYNIITKKQKIVNINDYSIAKKIRGFDRFMKFHILKIQERAKKEKKTDINLVSCDYLGPCNFTPWGEILFGKLQDKTSETIFFNNYQPYAGGFILGKTKGLQSTISTSFTLGIKKSLTTITTTATYNRLTNSINTGSISTKIGETTQYEEQF